MFAEQVVERHNQPLLRHSDLCMPVVPRGPALAQAVVVQPELAAAQFELAAAQFELAAAQFELAIVVEKAMTNTNWPPVGIKFLFLNLP